jgi:hypothetical protein
MAMEMGLEVRLPNEKIRDAMFESFKHVKMPKVDEAELRLTVRSAKSDLRMEAIASSIVPLRGLKPESPPLNRDHLWKMLTGVVRSLKAYDK